jgi:hypothetical protein
MGRLWVQAHGMFRFVRYLPLMKYLAYREPAR